MNVLKRLERLLIVILVVAMLFGISGCTAFHVQATGGTGKRGVEAAAAMSAGEAWPAGSGDMFSKSKKSIARAARD